VFFMAEYGSMVAVSGLGAILFLGGWHGPIPVADLLGLTHSNHAILGWMGELLGACNFLFKAFLGVTFMMWLRWTLPRLRIDQVMTDLFEILRAPGRGHVRGRHAVDLRVPGRNFASQDADRSQSGGGRRMTADDGR
jgi:hypothetical protein